MVEQDVSLLEEKRTSIGVAPMEAMAVLGVIFGWLQTITLLHCFRLGIILIEEPKTGGMEKVNDVMVRMATRWKYKFRWGQSFEIKEAKY
tara:strand:+ start:362 stop:631 length:270 start_codon:yes stop_codon:yes gene_type:complete